MGGMVGLDRRRLRAGRAGGAGAGIRVPRLCDRGSVGWGVGGDRRAGRVGAGAGAGLRGRVVGGLVGAEADRGGQGGAGEGLG